MARKGILSPETKAPAPPQERPTPKPSTAPRGAVGALQSSLTRLQENAVQDLDASLIDMAGVEDRLGVDDESQRKLEESMRAYGQQVPVLVRPHPSQAGRFEIVYGRRRLKALKAIGVPVKAMVRHLDDHALVMAQGQENTARQDLSFVEKASFAAQLDASGHDRQTIADALTIDLPMVSRMLKVGNAFDLTFLRKIGSAPGIGRDRWLTLAKLVQDADTKSRADDATTTNTFGDLTSDERFECVFKAASNKPTSKAPAPAATEARTLRSQDGKALADVRRTPRGLSLNISARTAGGFDKWLDTHAEELMREIHDRWRQSKA
ncbi:plasmid partitioning protein RepB (plasmid) [Sulfitobacter pontiacus]|uniref:plasmid partitioning protein RepB n=1 Tax=Sulfitobacter pontiacus TaxID=60137 RepID=UPI002AC8F11F|nr:plasmid partitioning protein RepB [Sulfitobacter pontiacus]WPZ27552.1 plasmid partitioning protein RepB [Sulfitobacter pontiacus]